MARLRLQPGFDPENKSRAYLWGWTMSRHRKCRMALSILAQYGRVIEHFHSRTKTSAWLNCTRWFPENYVEINSADAASLRVVTGNLIRVTSRRGEIVVKAKVTDTNSSGCGVHPMHFGDLDPLMWRKTVDGK